MTVARIFVDQQPYEVDAGQNLLQACLSLGLDLEYFCWHPALGSVGACRQCAVKMFKDEHDQRGHIVMACMTPVKEGTRIAIHDAEAEAFRAGIIEGLMLSHPHDCPVCDEGGECHLQDMTVMSGHVYRRSRFPKRTFRSQNLGPFVHHEMNRCIQCYRCVRFYRDYAGGHDLDAFGLRNLVYFGRYEDGVLESEFSGNLVEVCPTGVFTDATLYRHYTRKWDLQHAPSVCVHCGEGCNTSVGERYGLLRRIVNRYHHEVNGYFLCDRGRYGYEFVNSGARMRKPRLRSPDGVVALDRAAALEHASRLLRDSRYVIGIGSPRASLEANFALRALVGAERFNAGILTGEKRRLDQMLVRLRASAARSPSLADVEASDAILVLGEDLLNVAPRMALSVRQATRQRGYDIAASKGIPRWEDQAVRRAAQHERSPLILATCTASTLDEIASETYRAAPDDLVRFACAVAHAISPRLPPVPGLDPRVALQVERAARALASARRPTIIGGPSLGSLALIDAAALVASALGGAERTVSLAFTAPECNSFGLALLGGAPLDDVVRPAAQGEIDTLVILENDLSRRMGREAAEALLAQVPHVVVLDCLASPTSELAELVLPAATFAETEGTLVSREPRAQRFYRALEPAGEVRESWRWLRDLGVASGRLDPGAWQTLEDVTRAIAQAVPALTQIPGAAPPEEFRMAGGRIARAPNRYSGRTTMTANLSVHEPETPRDGDSPLAFQMEGDPRQPPAALTPYFWAPRWNSIQAVNRYQAPVGGPLRTGPAGLRMLEPAVDAQPPVFTIPAAFVPKAGRWLALPLYRIFGSDETSVHAEGLATLVEQPFVALRESDARALGVAAGEVVMVRGDGWGARLGVRVRGDLPVGTVGIVAGYRETAALGFPAWVGVARP
jgi:NADH-quinone oxidoreductase subunit G